MGRGRAKGKKLSVITRENAVSGMKERIPAQKRRGRPQKSPREVDDEGEKIEDGDSEDTSGKEMKSNAAMTADGKKSKRNAQVKDEVVEEGNGKAESNGFRQNRNRRKNKPRRAAEAVVECN